MNYNNGSEFVSNCSNLNIKSILCRYNSILSDNLIIDTANISNSPYTLIITMNTNSLSY